VQSSIDGGKMKITSINDCHILIVAGGSGERLGSTCEKPYVIVHGLPLLTWSIRYFLQKTQGPICVVVKEHDLQLLQQSLLLKEDEIERIILAPAGVERSDSVLNGLNKLADLPTDQTKPGILIHDAARPILVDKVIDSLLYALSTGAEGVIPVLPVSDTILRISDQGIVVDYPRRDHLKRVQTPQAFRFRLLLEVTRKNKSATTDESSLLHHQGHTIRAVPGDERMLKITWPEDLTQVATLLEKDNQ
jgi:2-C-methyl-D-erythritol 4-phosphate cytidylyltransferase/2-C-methyl-D-erythritol 2,4-cyclodiphosphate synthase